MTDKFGIGTLDLPVGQFSVFATVRLTSLSKSSRFRLNHGLERTLTPILLQWIVRPDKVAEVIPLIQENKRLCQDEPGTIEFHIARKGNKFYAWEK